ncbi:MAG: response regulator [Flavobacteriales bacterium]|nr:response regulator [Flavobacteriales bacterium]NNK79860.1 response regulator [Flavobacteriales bacterium]
MRTIVIDDERLARKELISLLKQFVHIDVISESSNADDAKKKIETLRPDLIFLDIQMPEKDGFQLLSELDYVPKVIFVTAYDEYALKAFEVSALDYLLKPVEPSRLEETLKRIEVNEGEETEKSSLTERTRLGQDDQIFLKDGDKCWFVTLSEVSRFQSEGNYVRVYFRNQKPMILRSLNNLEVTLDPRTFFRTNRKYIINLKWIDKVESWFNGGLMVTLKDGSEVEVSRRQAAKFKDSMSL